MSGRIPKQFIDDLLVRVDIVDLIDTHLPLKKTGSNYMARCPFHTEKTASFSVSRNKQMYHCFGCGVSGNAISFLMDYSHLGFVEAVEDLAAFVGVDVPREAGEAFVAAAKQDFSGIYQALEQAAAYYASQLRNAPGLAAREYLARRGVADEVVRDYQLGFAPQSWDALLRKFGRDVLVDAGLLVLKEDGGAYDRFRGRLMFPIRDKRKRVIGFGGRVLDDSLPKYLNSPETAVFSKGKELYGLCELLQNNARPERILVVEGYMDVIALAQHGICNAVATLGTATSKTQIELLFRFTSEVVFCFDGDNAGRQAAWKATEAALPCLRDGKQIRIMLLPQGQDPDSLVMEKGAAAFQIMLQEAEVLSDYFFSYLAMGLNMATLEGRSQLMVAAKPQLEKIPAGFFKDMMQRRLSELGGNVGRVVPENRSTLKRGVDLAKSGGRSGRPPSLLKKILALLAQNPGLETFVGDKNPCDLGVEFAGKGLLCDMLQKIALEKPGNGAILMESYRGSVHENMVRELVGMELGVPAGGEAAEFAGALSQLLRRLRQEKLNHLLGKEEKEGLTGEEKRVLVELLQERG